MQNLRILITSIKAVIKTITAQQFSTFCFIATATTAAVTYGAAIRLNVVTENKEWWNYNAAVAKIEVDKHPEKYKTEKPVFIASSCPECSQVVLTVSGAILDCKPTIIRDSVKITIKDTVTFDNIYYDAKGRQLVGVITGKPNYLIPVEMPKDTLDIQDVEGFDDHLAIFLSQRHGYFDLEGLVLQISLEKSRKYQIKVKPYYENPVH